MKQHNRKRILLILSNVHNIGLTGQQKIGKVLAEYLSNTEFEVSIITNSPDSDFLFNNQFNDRIDLLIIPGNATFYSFFLNLGLIIKSAKQFNPDIIHGHGTNSAFLTFLLGLILKCPTVQTVYDFRTFSGPLGFIRIFILARINKLIFNSVFVSEQIIEKGISKKKTEIIPYGLEKVWFNREISKSTDFPKVLFWGDTNFGRGIDTLLDAIPEVVKHIPDIKLILAIRYSEKKYMDKIAEISKTLPIEILKEKKQAISDVVYSADLIVLPYNFTTIQPPLTLIESMTTGKPVITTDVDANKEFIGENLRGMLIKKGDSLTLAKHIVYLLRNPEKAKKIGQNGRDFIKKTYDQETVTKKILKSYDSVNSNFQ